MAELPRTFQDAVTTTRLLGFRFLWIDSLCILQYSKQDWEQQSSKMADIYANGTINLAARAAPNATAGLFVERPESPDSCRLPYVDATGGLQGTMYMRDPSFKHEYVRQTPLDKRRWVLQKRLLSPRIVHFGSQQLHWECNEQIIRQDGKDPDSGLTRDDIRYGRDFKRDLIVSGPGAFSMPSLHTETALTVWYRVLEEYTRRNITYVSDTLPAISGLARAFAKRFDTTYAYGIWLEDISLGLARALSRPSSAGADPTIPTWSLVRFQEGISRSEYKGQDPPISKSTCCEVVDFTASQTGIDEFGPLQHARLIVRGPLVEVVYIPQTETWSSNTLTTILEPIGIAIFDLEETPARRQQLHCLLLFDNGSQGAELLLTQAEEGFQRVGVVSVRYEFVVDTSTGSQIRPGAVIFDKRNPQCLTLV